MEYAIGVGTSMTSKKDMFKRYYEHKLGVCMSDIFSYCEGVWIIDALWPESHYWIGTNGKIYLRYCP
jgi:hypothetical protein